MHVCVVIYYAFRFLLCYSSTYACVIYHSCSVKSCLWVSYHGVRPIIHPVSYEKWPHPSSIFLLFVPCPWANHGFLYCATHLNSFLEQILSQMNTVIITVLIQVVTLPFVRL
jgi:hypothetical protein